MCIVWCFSSTARRAKFSRYLLYGKGFGGSGVSGGVGGVVSGFGGLSWMRWCCSRLERCRKFWSYLA